MRKTKFSKPEEAGKAEGSGFWSGAKDRYALALAGAALAAALAGGCGGRTGMYPPCGEQDCACDGGGAVQDSGRDSGHDGGMDGGTDAGNDGGVPQQTVLWEGKNLIDDHLNRTLGDRKQNSMADSDTAYPLGGPDTNENANPFTDGKGGTIGPSNIFLHRLDGNQVADFAALMLDDAAAAETYTESQDIWLEGDNHFSGVSQSVLGRLSFVAYTLRFDGPASEEAGIPVCTHDAGGTGDYTSCKSAPAALEDATETHRLRIRFLGEDWVVSEMNAPGSGSLADPDGLANGGSLKLAKEAVSGILNLGESLAVDALRFRLDGVETSAGAQAAIISVLDPDDNVLKMDKVSTGQTKEFMIGGNAYRFHCYKTASSATATWADVALYSKEIELRDGQELDADNGLNSGFKVALGWKNRQASPQSDRPDSLRRVAVYSDSIEEVASSGDSLLNIGDYVPLFNDPSAWKISYGGLDLQPADLVALRFEIKTSDLAIPASQGPQINGKDYGCTISAPYVRVSSGATGAVFGTMDVNSPPPGSMLGDNSFLVPLADVHCQTQTGEQATFSGPQTFMKLSPASSRYGNGLAVINYGAIGDPSTSPLNGLILVRQSVGIPVSIMQSAGASCSGGSCEDPAMDKPGVADAYFLIAEKAGEGASYPFADYFIFGIDNARAANPADATFSFDSKAGNGFQISAVGKLLYGNPSANSASDQYSGAIPTGPVEGGMELASPGFVSGRGSEVEAVSQHEVRLNMAHKLAKAVWRLIGGG